MTYHFEPEPVDNTDDTYRQEWFDWIEEELEYLEEKYIYDF